jgi:hypothetical protein
MLTRIKHWRKFQHYKHRDPPWIRLYRNLLNDREWFSLDGDAAKVLIMCWLIASENDGTLPKPADLAFRFRMTEKQINAALSKLSHWLEHDASTALADCLHDAPPETETEADNTETDNSDLRAVASATRPSLEEDFQRFWKAYPRRDGANPKSPAKRKFIGAVRSGADPLAIISAAESYASEEAAKDRVGTPYIAQAVTWLNQRRWEDFAPGESLNPVMGPPEPGLPSREELLQRYGTKRREIERTSPESPSILAESLRVCGEEQDELVSHHGKGNGAASSLAEILPSSGMGAMVGEADEAWPDQDRDDAY